MQGKDKMEIGTVRIDEVEPVEDRELYSIMKDFSYKHPIMDYFDKDKVIGTYDGFKLKG